MNRTSQEPDRAQFEREVAGERIRAASRFATTPVS